MSDMEVKLQSLIDNTTKNIKDVLTELGLNGVGVEPCEVPERLREKGEELMPYFAGGHFNGWFQVSSQEGNFKIGFVAESVPILDLLGTGITIKDILENIPRNEEDDEDVDDLDDEDCSYLNHCLPLMDERVIEVFVRLFKN